ncbi:Steroid receptor RNA activator 1 [Portunus trituberculatus]|uniref:Steroid receptor RNA activator 1 n=1 Tax=Portunus trituberculatus TaxID=210409 RepID=A0A5B7E2C2_PORTR|nr:Steroid receptor RNA activator 1 [Portunus trituberculatus]
MLTSNLQPLWQESTQEEIRKRIEVMVDMWQKDQLSLEVQNRMMTLTQALSEHNYDKAWSVHQSLIVDYTTTCSPWMVGIKTLIAESRSLSEATLGQDEGNKFETGDAVPVSNEGEESVSKVSSIK